MKHFIILLSAFIVVCCSSACSADRDRILSITLNADGISQSDLVNMVQNYFEDSGISLDDDNGTQWFQKFIYETKELELIIDVIDAQLEIDDPIVITIVVHRRRNNDNSEGQVAYQLESILAVYQSLASEKNITTRVYFDTTGCWRMSRDNVKVSCNAD